MNGMNFAIMLGSWFAGGELLLILMLAVLLLLGIGKLPILVKGLSRGIAEFVKSADEVAEELRNWRD